MGRKKSSVRPRKAARTSGRRKPEPQLSSNCSDRRGRFVKKKGPAFLLWHTLPEGPLLRVFELMYQQTGGNDEVTQSRRSCWVASRGCCATYRAKHAADKARQCFVAAKVSSARLSRMAGGRSRNSFRRHSGFQTTLVTSFDDRLAHRPILVQTPCRMLTKLASAGSGLLCPLPQRLQNPSRPSQPAELLCWRRPDRYPVVSASNMLQRETGRGTPT